MNVSIYLFSSDSMCALKCVYFKHSATFLQLGIVPNARVLMIARVIHIAAVSVLRGVHPPTVMKQLLSFPSLPSALPLFNGGPGYHFWENFGIKGACR